MKNARYASLWFVMNASAILATTFFGYPKNLLAARGYPSGTVFMVFVLSSPIVFLNLITAFGIYKNKKWGWMIAILISLLSTYSVLVNLNLFSSLPFLRKIWVLTTFIVSMTIIFVSLKILFFKNQNKN